MRDDQEIINDDKCKTEELENIAMILSGISDNMFSAPSVSASNKGTYFLSGESIIASENTIKSIDFCCQRGYFADAFTLARKYRDDVIQYIFLTQIIDNMSRISDEEVKEYCGKDLSVGNLLQVIEKSLNILRDGTLVDGAFEYGSRGEDHRLIECCMNGIDRYDKQFWSKVHTELGVVQLVPETQTILIMEGQNITTEQKEIIDKLNEYSLKEGIPNLEKNVIEKDQNIEDDFEDFEL